MSNAEKGRKKIEGERLETFSIKSDVSKEYFVQWSCSVMQEEWGFDLAQVPGPTLIYRSQYTCLQSCLHYPCLEMPPSHLFPTLPLPQPNH